MLRLLHAEEEAQEELARLRRAISSGQEADKQRSAAQAGDGVGVMSS